MKLEHFHFWLVCKLQAVFDGDQVLRKILCQIKHTFKTESTEEYHSWSREAQNNWLDFRKSILTAELNPTITRKQLHNMGRTQCSRENKGINYSTHFKKVKTVSGDTACSEVQLGTMIFLIFFYQFFPFCVQYCSFHHVLEKHSKNCT